MRKLKFSVVSIGVFLAGAALLILSVTLINNTVEYAKIEVTKTEAKNSAIHDCLQSATVKTKEDNTERIEPIFYIYELCLKDKGYETSYTNGQ